MSKSIFRSPTYIVLTTLWFGSLAGLLIEINNLFPDVLSFPFF